MKKLTYSIRAVAFILMLTIFMACSKEQPEDTQTDEQTAEKLLTISGEVYTLIRPDNASENVMSVFSLLSNELTRLQGSQFPIGNDFVPNYEEIPQNNPEILLGNTNRNASREVLQTLGEGEWAVTVKGNQIVIVGENDLALWQAANEFLSNCIVSENNTVCISESLDIGGILTSLDNSEKIPQIRPDSETTLLVTSSDGEAYTPDWVNDLIIMEANLANATEEGTLESSYRIIDHLAQLGVNGLWITPIGDRSTMHFYGNLGLHTIDSELTGTTDYEEGWKKFTEFVSYAHSKNIRIFLDVVTWGTTEDSSLYKEHPDWYTGEDVWSGKAFDWDNRELREWYIETATDIILSTGIDGLRCDCEPDYAGYELFAEIRNHCLQAGRKIVIFSELSNTRDGAFDFEQFGVFDYGLCSFSDQQELKLNWFMRDKSIVSAIRNSKMIGDTQQEIQNKTAYYRYFTYCVSCHDFSGTAVNGNILTLAYQALFAPFIPIWYLGEEFGWDGNGGSGSLLYREVDWSDAEKPENAAFLEQVKQLIAIRRDYADVFSVYTENHRESNICAVKTTGLGETITAYARYNASRAVLIVPNTSGADGEGEVTIPFSAMDLNASDTWQIKDLLTGDVIAQGTGQDISNFKVFVPDNSLGVYSLERV